MQPKIAESFFFTYDFKDNNKKNFFLYSIK